METPYDIKEIVSVTFQKKFVVCTDARLESIANRKSNNTIYKKVESISKRRCIGFKQGMEINRK